MVSHILIDSHESTLNDSRIIGVVKPPSSGTINTESTAGFTIQIPDGIDVSEATTFSELSTLKWAGVLSQNPKYTYIAYDDMMTSSGIDTSNSDKFVGGSRGSNAVFAYGQIQTSAVALSSTPTVVVPKWDIFKYVYTNTVDARMNRIYRKMTGASMTLDISLDGGSTFPHTNLTLNTGEELSIPLANRGSSLVMRFKHSNAAPEDKYHIGGWCVLY